MSGLKVASYRDLEAERRRAETRDLAHIVRNLEKLERLAERLSRFEDVPEYLVASVRARLATASQPMTPDERQDVIRSLASEIVKFEHAIARANEDRERLSLLARSLARQTSGEKRQFLETVVRKSSAADRDTFTDLRSRVEAVVTEAILEEPAAASERTDISTETRDIVEALMSPSIAKRTLSTLENPKQAQINRFLDMLGQIGEAGAHLRTRAQDVFDASAESDFQLKLDALYLDAAAVREAERNRHEARAVCEEALDMLAPLDDAVSEEFKMRLQQGEEDDAEGRRSLARKAIDHAQLIVRQKDARRARESMIDGLKSLGYEVHIEGEEWKPGQRITVSRPDEPNYDVQLAAREDGKVQTKVRAYQHGGRSGGVNARDAEVEERWCSDIRTLHARMETEGLGAMLERDEAPGALPAVVIERPERRDDKRADSKLRIRKPGA